MCDCFEFVTAYQLAVEEYRRLGGKITDRTVKNNVSNFLRIASIVGAKTVEEFNATRAPIQWRMDYLTRHAGDGKQEEKLRISAASYCTAAASLWMKQLLPIYDKLGFKVPAFDKEAWPSKRGIQYIAYSRPPLELRRRTAEWYERLDAENSELWVAVTLIYRFAVRPSDAAFFTWEVFREDEPGKWILDYIPNKTKGRCNTLRRVKWGVASELLEKLRARGGEHFVLPQRTQSARYNVFVRDICRELRAIGWTADKYEKASYELRKLCIDTAYSVKGPAAAAQISGDDIKTVMRHYADANISLEPVDIFELAKGRM